MAMTGKLTPSGSRLAGKTAKATRLNRTSGHVDGSYMPPQRKKTTKQPRSKRSKQASAHIQNLWGKGK